MNCTISAFDKPKSCMVISYIVISDQHSSHFLSTFYTRKDLLLETFVLSFYSPSLMIIIAINFKAAV